MVEIYLTSIRQVIKQEHVEHLKAGISKKNQNRCKKFRFYEDTLRTLYGEAMVRSILAQKLAIKNKDIKISWTRFGKPYADGLPVQFNISHAGDWVVVAISENEVGVDIEQIKEVEMNLAERYFNKEEHAYIQRQEETNRLAVFYAIWTLKESYVKWLGTGLSMPINSFSFQLNTNGISMSGGYTEVAPAFKQYSLPGYKLSVCSRDNQFLPQLKVIDLNQCYLPIRGDVDEKLNENQNNEVIKMQIPDYLGRNDLGSGSQFGISHV